MPIDETRTRSAIVQIPYYLGGISYPADKQQLIEYARGQKAPDNVISLLYELPERRYEFPTDVETEVNRLQRTC